ncbi:hypothetical protein [Anabaena sp. UHCC 0253]|uniref:hypothetical protein n=1 Tax=Anabaena sp. UHCC 0253 TaxID=2590019 RepID=UPI0014463C96|nr:hypothetical protein [Anabaena sp. UHCC 0253]
MNSKTNASENVHIFFVRFREEFKKGNRVSLEKLIHKDYSSTGSLICQNRESLVNFFLLFKALTIPFVYEMDLEIKPFKTPEEDGNKIYVAVKGYIIVYAGRVKIKSIPLVAGDDIILVTLLKESGIILLKEMVKPEEEN